MITAFPCSFTAFHCSFTAFPLLLHCLSFAPSLPFLAPSLPFLDLPLPFLDLPLPFLVPPLPLLHRLLLVPSSRTTSSCCTKYRSFVRARAGCKQPNSCCSLSRPASPACSCALLSPLRASVSRAGHRILALSAPLSRFCGGRVGDTFVCSSPGYAVGRRATEDGPAFCKCFVCTNKCTAKGWASLVPRSVAV